MNLKTLVEKWAIRLLVAAMVAVSGCNSEPQESVVTSYVPAPEATSPKEPSSATAQRASDNTRLTTTADLTVEEYELAREDQGGLTAVRQALTQKSKILDKRKPWRDLPMTDGVALTLTPEEQMHLLHYPVRVGDSAAYVRANRESEVEVVQNNQVVYTYLHPEARRMTSPSVMVKGFAAWDGTWVLETVEAEVLVGGESLNERLGYSEIFGFRMIAGKPFYFFTKDGKVRVSYDGEVLPQLYDQVPHYGCCDSAEYNPQGSERMVSFFGRRGDQWYYVEMGAYN